MKAQYVPEFLRPYKPKVSQTKELDDILSNWMKTHEIISEKTKDMDLRQTEAFVGSLLYQEIVGRRRMHMINKLKGKLSFLMRDREEKDILQAIAYAEAAENNNAGKIA